MGTLVRLVAPLMNGAFSLARILSFGLNALLFNHEVTRLFWPAPIGFLPGSECDQTQDSCLVRVESSVVQISRLQFEVGLSFAVRSGPLRL